MCLGKFMNRLSNFFSPRCCVCILFVFGLSSESVFAEHIRAYSLARVGSLNVSGNNANEQQTVGAVVGWRVNFSFYVEGELNYYVSGGDYQDGVEKGVTQISTLGLYGAYRYVLDPNYYLKLKAGLVYEDIIRQDLNSQNESSTNGSSGSGGLGLGIVFNVNKNPVMIEIEATMIEENIMLYTIGMTNPF